MLTDNNFVLYISDVTYLWETEKP